MAAPAAPGPSDVAHSSSSSAPLSSVLSDPPSESANSAPQTVPTTAVNTSAAERPYSAQTEEIVKRINANAATAAASGTPGWEAAREQIMRDYPTAEKLATPDAASVAKERSASTSSAKMNGDTIAVATPAAPAAAAARGSARGRPRGRGRGRGGGRGGKRKREDRDDDDEDGNSDSSEEVYTPAARQTKSGRAVQKPTAFVPPALPSPTASGNKRRKGGYRRNPESAVCKVCLRGTSPASNMIVFCDSCNTPYHRYCHHPPIDQSVVDEVDKEWMCQNCETERVVPVPEKEVVGYVSAGGVGVEQRQRYFGSLPQGLLVTLLTRATTLHPDLPVFAPDFQTRAAASATSPSASQPSVNGHHQAVANPSPLNPSLSNLKTPSGAQPTAYSQPPAPHVSGPELAVPGGHPPTYPRPGHGLMKTLPPENTNYDWLVEDGDQYGVFSHGYLVDPQAAQGAQSNGAVPGGGNGDGNGTVQR